MTDSQRRAVRVPVRTLVCNLDHWNEATVLNVSEGGLALEAIAPVNMNRPVEVILDWAEASGSIAAGGEVVWQERKRTGMRFTSLGETSRARLVEWLFQDLAARFAQRQYTPRDNHPHGLTLPAPMGQRAAAPAFPSRTAIPAAAERERHTLRLTALLTAERQGDLGVLELAALLDLMAKRAQCITGASGAAIALATGGPAVCMASSGAIAPDVGVTISGGHSLAAECLRSGAIVRCDDAAADPRTDPEHCRQLGIRSALLVPLTSAQTAFTGVLGVFSERISAFNECDLATLQRMKDVIIAASQLPAAPTETC